jgi:hypothetical protein
MRYSKAIIAAGLWSIMAITNAQSQNGAVSEEMDVEAQAAVDARAIASYWTAEEMANAKPMPIPTFTVDPLSLAVPRRSEESGEPAAPGYAPGCRPNARNCNNAARTLSSQNAFPSAEVAHGDLIQPMDGSKPTNPKDGPYGPFQRWREANPITDYPQINNWKIILHAQ